MAYFTWARMSKGNAASLFNTFHIFNVSIIFELYVFYPLMKGIGMFMCFLIKKKLVTNTSR